MGGTDRRGGGAGDLTIRYAQQGAGAASLPRAARPIMTLADDTTRSIHQAGFWDPGPGTGATAKPCSAGAGESRRPASGLALRQAALAPLARVCDRRVDSPELGHPAPAHKIDGRDLPRRRADQLYNYLASASGSAARGRLASVRLGTLERSLTPAVHGDGYKLLAGRASGSGERASRAHAGSGGPRRRATMHGQSRPSARPSTRVAIVASMNTASAVRGELLDERYLDVRSADGDHESRAARRTMRPVR